MSAGAGTLLFDLSHGASPLLSLATSQRCYSKAVSLGGVCCLFVLVVSFLLFPP